MTTVFSPSASSSSTLTTASVQLTSPGMFLKAYHIPTCYILQHEKSLRFPEFPTDVKIKKQTNKKTTTGTWIICSRSIIVYLGQLEKHRPVPKQMDGGSNRPLVFQKLVYSYFEKVCRKKMCMRQSRMAIWDMTNTRFLTLWLPNLLLWLSFSTANMTMASRAILSNFFEKQLTQNHPQYLSGWSPALFPTTFLEIAVCGLFFDYVVVHMIAI